MDLNTNDLLNLLSKRKLDVKEVHGILGNPKKFPTDLIEKISIETALKYWTNNLAFKDGDCIMNNLYFYWQLNPDNTAPENFSKISMDCYEAFDAGEYQHAQDGLEINPEQKYTKPMIAAVLKSINRIQ